MACWRRAPLAPCTVVGLALDLSQGGLGSICAVPRSLVDAAVTNLAMMPCMNLGMAAGGVLALVAPSVAFRPKRPVFMPAWFCITAHIVMLFAVALGSVLMPISILSPWRAVAVMCVTMGIAAAVFALLLQLTVSKIPWTTTSPVRAPHGATP